MVLAIDKEMYALWQLSHSPDTSGFHKKWLISEMPEHLILNSLIKRIEQFKL